MPHSKIGLSLAFFYPTKEKSLIIDDNYINIVDNHIVIVDDYINIDDD